MQSGYDQSVKVGAVKIQPKSDYKSLARFFNIEQKRVLAKSLLSVCSITYEEEAGANDFIISKPLLL